MSNGRPKLDSIDEYCEPDVEDRLISPGDLASMCANVVCTRYNAFSGEQKRTLTRCNSRRITHSNALHGIQEGYRLCVQSNAITSQDYLCPYSPLISSSKSISNAHFNHHSVPLSISTISRPKTTLSFDLHSPFAFIAFHALHLQSILQVPPNIPKIKEHVI